MFQGRKVSSHVFCVGDIDFDFFYEFSILSWKCSNSVVFFVFHFISNFRHISVPPYMSSNTYIKNKNKQTNKIYYKAWIYIFSPSNHLKKIKSYIYNGKKVAMTIKPMTIKTRIQNLTNNSIRQRHIQCQLKTIFYKEGCSYDEVDNAMCYLITLTINQGLYPWNWIFIILSPNYRLETKKSVFLMWLHNMMPWKIKLK